MGVYAVFRPPFDVLGDLVFGAYFQVVDVDDGLFACRHFAGDEGPELIILIFVCIVRVPLRLFSSPAGVGLRAGRVCFCFFVTRYTTGGLQIQNWQSCGRLFCRHHVRHATEEKKIV